MNRPKETCDEYHPTKPRNRRAPPLRLAACVTLLMVLAGVGTAAAATTSGVAPSGSRVSFTGETFAAESNETVDIAARSRSSPGSAVRNPPAGPSTGRSTSPTQPAPARAPAPRYLGAGADDGSVLFPPGPPTHPPSPIHLLVDTQFDETGQVTAITVQIEDATYGTID